MAQNVLAQKWHLADCDKNGNFSLEEFLLAMHLCEYANMGNPMPNTLPTELIPRSRAQSPSFTSTTTSRPPLPPLSEEGQSTSEKTSQPRVNSTSKSSSPLTATAAAAPTPTTTPAVIKTDSVNTLPSDSVIDQVQALYDFQSSTPETISFSKDAVINILEKSGDWWLGELNGKIGLLPFNYVQSILTLSNNG
jgi:hypothetical protein